MHSQPLFPYITGVICSVCSSSSTSVNHLQDRPSRVWREFERVGARTTLGFGLQRLLEAPALSPLWLILL